MSLINQALRKAQRDRTPNRMPQDGPPAPAIPGYSKGDAMRPALVIGMVVAIALLLGLVAGLSIVVLNGGSSAPAATAATPQAPAMSAAPFSPPIDPQITPPATIQSSQTITPPESSIVAELRKAREAAEAKAAEQAHTAAAEAETTERDAAEAAARAAAQPSEEIIEWLSRSKVTGVRISENESRVILNGQTYAAGETVNFKLGLKVLIIQETRILFVDNNDKKYMKRL